MHTSTQRNWQALQRLSLAYLKELRHRHPEWKLDDPIAEFELPRTALFLDMAQKAGFVDAATPTAEQVCAVAGMVMRGMWSEATISSGLGIPIETVRAIFESHSKGYGTAPFGVSAYGGNRAFSNGKNGVSRRVTVAGQLSYRGKIYTLGAAYRGRNALVCEKGKQILVSFRDRSPLVLTRRH